MFEDIRGIVRSRKSKDPQCNGQAKKCQEMFEDDKRTIPQQRRNNYLQNMTRKLTVPYTNHVLLMWKIDVPLVALPVIL